jgi:hypothetical protein
MTEVIKWICKNLVVAGFWLFILSIDYKGRPLFYTAHDVLIKNSLVQSMDQQLSEIWGRVSTTAKKTYDDLDKPENTTL